MMRKNHIGDTIGWIKAGLLTLAVLSLPFLGTAQCNKLKVKEMTGFPDTSGTFFVTDSVVYFYDADNNLVRSETHADIRSDFSIRYTTFFEAEGDEVIREKVVCDRDFMIIEAFMMRYPGARCLERTAEYSSGDIYAREDMSDLFYSMKSWDGVDAESNIYCKYQSGASSRENPELFYTYKDIDGEWIVNEIDIMEKNEHGDFTTIQTVISGGYGYNKTEYRYHYDACGNWTAKETKGASGKHYLMVLREVDYED